MTPATRVLPIGFTLAIASFVACGGATTSGITAEGTDAGADASSTTTTDGGSAGSADAAAVQITLMNLPVGDGKYGAAPKKGYV